MSSCRAARPDPLNGIIRNWIWIHLKSTELRMTLPCRAARPDPHYSRCTVIKVRHHGRIMNLMRNWPFCDVFFHCRTFHSASIVNCTENEPLLVSYQSRVNMFDKGADTMRMFIAKRMIVACRQKSDQLWREAKTNVRSAADFTRRGWNIKFWHVLFEPYDIPWNNQPCFDFTYWPGHSTFETFTRSPHHGPGLP